MSNTLPSAEFWKVYQGLLTLDAEGNIFFTKKGKETYAPLFSRFGFSLGNIRTLEAFREAMRTISLLEIDENNRKMEKMLASPDTPEEEKTIIRRIMGREPEVTEAVVVNLADARSRFSRTG